MPGIISNLISRVRLLCQYLICQNIGDLIADSTAIAE